jgi:hypothetical protein
MQLWAQVTFCKFEVHISSYLPNSTALSYLSLTVQLEINHLWLFEHVVRVAHHEFLEGPG